jgi:hypothetical protein
MELHRETLFEQVWSTPISRLCKTYGLSDQGLRKACVKLQIPLPERGHWAKVAAGHKMDRPALPPLRPQSHRASPKRKMPRLAALPAIGTKVPAIAEVTATPLTGSFHSAIRLLVPEYIQAEKEALQLKAKFDWEQEHPGRTFKGAAPRFGHWQSFFDNGQILRPTHKKCFVRVSLLTYKRAFRLLQVLMEKLESAGFAVELGSGRERLKATRDSAAVSIRLIERLEAGQRKELNSWSKEPRFVRTLSPTGRLVIGIEQQGLGESQVTDRSDEPLEDQLDAIMVAVEFRHRRSAETLKQWKQQRQESEERERARQDELRLREAARRSQEAENARRQALVQEAKDWHAADTLRTYLSQLELRRTSGGRPMDDYVVWLAWAVEVAQALDPSDRRVAQSGSVDARPEQQND